MNLQCLASRPIHGTVLKTLIQLLQRVGIPLVEESVGPIPPRPLSEAEHGDRDLTLVSIHRLKLQDTEQSVRFTDVLRENFVQPDLDGEHLQWKVVEDSVVNGSRVADLTAILIIGVKLPARAALKFDGRRHERFQAFGSREGIPDILQRCVNDSHLAQHAFTPGSGVGRVSNVFFAESGEWA